MNKNSSNNTQKIPQPLSQPTQVPTNPNQQNINNITPLPPVQNIPVNPSLSSIPLVAKPS